MDKRQFVKGGFDAIASRYDLANRLLSFGADALWRRKAVGRLGERPLVLDLCAGTLPLSAAYLRRFRAQVVALDFSLRMLRVGLKRRTRGGLLPLCGDALRLPFPEGTFSGAMVAFGLRNLSDPWQGLKELYRVLAPGAKAVILEFGRPRLPLFRQIYHLYLAHFIPWAGGLITGNSGLHAYLYRSIVSFPSKEEILRQMEQVGFRGLRALDLTLGVCVLYEGVKP